MKKKICFLTCKALIGQIKDDEIIHHELTKDNFEISLIAWDSEAQWENFDLVIIRTTWDYVQRIDEFLEKISFIASRTKIYNSAEVIKWNYHKSYLSELESKNVRIVPTYFFNSSQSFLLPSHWSHEQFIIKPAISAGSYLTRIINRNELEEPEFFEALGPGDWMLQPFIKEITQGEISLLYFNHQFSHALTKVPKSGEFRVQEEFGGDIIGLNPPSDLLSLGDHILAQVPYELLYARVDLVHYQGEYHLMELELIEPDLYIRTNFQSVINFHQAIDKIFTNT